MTFRDSCGAGKWKDMNNFSNPIALGNLILTSLTYDLSV